MRPAARTTLTALCAGAACWPALSSAQHPGEATTPATSYVRRLEGALLLQTLNAELLSHDSASVTLQHWCEAHHLASPARITAERVHEADKPITDIQRQRLRIGAADAVRYRRVRLRCGTVTLSEADNWYVPARLTPQMNQLLESTDTPFGIVVQPLHFQRHTIAAEVLWQALPEGWEMTPPAAADAVSEPCFPAQVLQHRALLTLPDGTPFSEVVETYTSSVLSVPRLAPAHSC